MKADTINTPIVLSHSLKNINTNNFKKSASSTSLNNDILINELTVNKQNDSNPHNLINEKKMNVDETAALSPTKITAKLQFDRRSFYDNHKWIDEIQEVDDEDEENDDDDDDDDEGCRIPKMSINQTHSYLMNNNDDIEDEENLEDYQDTLSLKAQMNFKSPEKSSQIESLKVERDAFDDLVDLSHRVSKEDLLLKKTEENLKLKDETEISHFKSCDSISNTNNSSTNTNGKDYNTSSLPPLPYSFVRLEKSKAKNVTNSNLTPTSSPRPSTTRIIIPMNQNKISTSNIDLNNSTMSSKTISTNYQSSCETYMTNSQSQNLLNIISPVDVNRSSKSDSKTLLNRSNSYGFSVIKNDDQPRISSKTNDANKDWDQISKIFQSLETMLNEVCETTYKNSQVTPKQNNYYKGMITNKSPSHLDESLPIKNPDHHHHSHQHHVQHIESSTSPSSLSSCSSPTSSFSNKSTPPKFNDEKLSNKIESSTSNDQMSTIDDEHILNDEVLMRNPNYFQHVEVGNFLKCIDLFKYEFKFITNGYDHLNFMNNVINLQDLVQIGIDNYDDIFKILREIKNLPSSIKKISDKHKIFNNIEEWLEYLNLSEYLVNFRVNNINSMKRVLTLWEIELTTVLQIPFIGHRRRLMASIEAILKPPIPKRLADKNIDLEILQKSISNAENELNFSSASSSSSNSFISQNNLLNKNSTKLTPKKDENNIYQKSMVLSTPSLSTPIQFNKSVKFNEEKNNLSSQQFHPKLNNFIAKSDVKLNETSTTKTPKISQLTQLKNFLKSSPRLNRSNFSSLTRDNNKKKRPEFGTIPKKQGVSGDIKKKFEPTLKTTMPNSQSDNNNFSYTNQDLNILPKKVWNKDPQLLIRGGSYNFSVQYLGSSALTKINSNQDPVKYTIDRLKNSTRSTPYASPQVEIGISINGVQMLHSKTKEVLWNHDIKHINNVCQDQDDLNYFAFSTQTDQASHYYCHVFSCKDKDLSTQIILTIGQAFDVAYELFCKNNVF